MISTLPKNRPTIALSLWLKVSCPMLLAVLALALAGCEATALSDKAQPTWQSTASYDYVTSHVTGDQPKKIRPWPVQQVCYQRGTVRHFGFYYDDPFVTQGDGDNLYGWTSMDTVAVAYCPIRFAINTLAVPFSMIKEPPGVLVAEHRDQVGDMAALSQAPTSQPAEGYQDYRSN